MYSYLAAAAPDGIPPSSKIAGTVDTYVQCVMEYGEEWAVATSVTDEDPLFARLLRIDFFFAAEAMAEATAAVAAVRGVDTTPRNAAYVEAYTEWVAGDLLASAACFERALLLAPVDAFALKRAQLLYFLGGAPGDMLRVTVDDRVGAAQVGAPYYHGMLAFALEQNGDLTGCLEHGKKGVDLVPSDLWAVHAVAHALYFQGKVADGVEWLQSTRASWKGCSFIVSHLWWHLALCLIDAGDFDTCFELYDAHVFAIDPTNSQDQMGALGLLLKLHIRMRVTQAALSSTPLDLSAPAEVSTRLEDAVAKCAPKLTYHGDPFFDTLLAYALGACGDDAGYATLSDTATSTVAGLPEARRGAAGTPWLRGMSALHAFAKGDAGAAVGHFKAFSKAFGEDGAVRLDSAALGNSSEQRDVLDEALFVCLVASGGAPGALAIARQRQRLRPDIPSDAFMEAVAGGGTAAATRGRTLQASHTAAVKALA